MEGDCCLLVRCILWSISLGEPRRRLQPELPKLGRRGRCIPAGPAPPGRGVLRPGAGPRAHVTLAHGGGGGGGSGSAGGFRRLEPDPVAGVWARVSPSLLRPPLRLPECGWRSRDGGARPGAVAGRGGRAAPRGAGAAG